MKTVGKEMRWPVVLFVLVCGGIVLAAPLRAMAEGENPPAPLPAGVFEEIDALRQRVHLTNEDLAALGCTRERAESVLRAVKTWHETHRAALADLLSNKAAKALRRALRTAGTAEDAPTPEEIEALKTARAEALAEKKRLMQDLIGTIVPLLNTDQRSRWRTARKNGRGLGPLRFAPDLTREQKDQLDEARQAYDAACDEAETDAQALAAKTALKTRVGEILFSDQLRQVEAAADDARTRAADVLAASAEVLPPPEHVAAGDPSP